MPLFEPSNDRLKDLWDSGVPLNSAWVEFAESFDSLAHRPLPARQEQVVVTSRNKRIHLLGELYAGRLWAIGFKRFLDGSAELVRVPRRDFFLGESFESADIQWDESALTVGTTAYFDIRIARAPERSRSGEQAGHSEPSSKPSKSRQSKSRTRNPAKRKSRTNVGGRPNTRNDIERKTHELWKTSPKFRTMSRKEMIEEVRASLLGEGQRKDEIRGHTSSHVGKCIGRALSSIRERK